MTDSLRYPIGLFDWDQPAGDAQVHDWITEIDCLPAELRNAVEGLSPREFERTYRPNGWTIRQLVHHIGDSHLNSLVRFKWALTEDNPTIKPYFEDRWAELEDYRSMSIELGLDFVEAVHGRLVALLRTLSRGDLQKTFYHPEYDITVRLGSNVGNYAWHGKHHVAHIELAKQD